MLTDELAVRIRRATPADAAALGALARRAKAHWGYPREWMEAWEAQLTITPAYVAEVRVYAACDDAGTIVGTCALEDHGHRWVIEHVWVAPERHGRGVGAALVRRALAEAAAVRPGEVTLTSDPHAAAFYERLGARHVGVVPAPMPGAPDRTLPCYAFDARRER